MFVRGFSTCAIALLALTLASCQKANKNDFQHQAERFGDVQILRYQVPGFEALDLRNKTLLYYLHNASLAGRDIFWDQNYRHNLKIRHLLEATLRHYPGDRDGETYQKLLSFCKMMWLSNGIHFYASHEKIKPSFSGQELSQLVRAASKSDGFPFGVVEVDDLLIELQHILFDPSVDPKKVNKEADADKAAASAVNFYRGVNEREVSDFYNSLQDSRDPEPVSYGLNSRLVKNGNQLEEQVWKMDGLYSEAIEQAVFWLEKALTVTENPNQHEALTRLIQFYRSGDLKDFDRYNVAWLKDTESTVDLIHGFIEVYNDPLAYRGSYEAVLSIRDSVASERIATLAQHAQWFEDNAPIMAEHKKATVVGIDAKVINVVIEAGATNPTSPSGINLPNSSWIRKQHGSKSVSLGNIVDAYSSVGGQSQLEFAYSKAERERQEKYGQLARQLSTDLHEVIGHASGQLNPGVAPPQQTLKQYGSTLEEARADLFSLYFMLDEKLVELGLIPNLEVGKTRYEQYIRNGLMMQLNRVSLGRNLENDHMRNRQLVASWAYQQGKEAGVIEKIVREGKTYFVIRDYSKLRQLFGQLLREIQRIKSEGDLIAARNLVETYGITVDREIHREVLQRYAKLDLPSHRGFINPELRAVKNEQGDIIDVTIHYPDDFTQQMLDYGEKWSFLPLENP